MSVPKIVVFLADGFEEVEAVTPIDYLRRSGAEVITAGVNGRKIKGSHGITLEADLPAESVDFQPDCIVLPGGMPGASNLAASKTVNQICLAAASSKKILAAICAAPAVIFGPLGLLDGKSFTCYPGFEERVPAGKAVKSRVVVDGNIITARAAGTAGEFSMAIIKALCGGDKAKSIAEAVLLSP